MYHSVSTVLALFLVVAFVIGLILALSVVTKKDCELEEDKANTTRATLILLVAFVVGVIVLVSQRMELADTVKHMMA